MYFYSVQIKEISLLRVAEHIKICYNSGINRNKELKFGRSYIPMQYSSRIFWSFSVKANIDFLRDLAACFLIYLSTHICTGYVLIMFLSNNTGSHNCIL